MKPLRPGVLKWNGVAIFVAGGLLFSSAAFGASAAQQLSAKGKRAPSAAGSSRLRGLPNAAAKGPTGVPSSPPSAETPGDGAANAQREHADIYPTNRIGAPDLGLTEDNTRKAEAMATFAQALLAGDAAEKEKELAGYRKTLALDPGCTELAVQVAYELTKRNDAGGAIQVLKDAAKAKPREALPLIYLAQIYAKQLKKPDLAQKYAEQALALAPDDFQVHNALYEIQIAAGQPKKAEEVLDRASKSKSTDPHFWLQLGDLSTRLYLKEDGSSEPEQIQRMNAVYRKAAELGKDDPATLMKAGDYFVLSRQVPESIPYYQNALRLRPATDDPVLSNLREKLARAYLVTDQRDQAIEILEADVHENPMRYGTFELLGELYLKKGNLEKAMRNFEQTLLIDSSRPENYLRLADLYLQLKQTDKAVEMMRTARGKFPDVPRIVFVLAVTLSQAKKHTEAMTAFAEAQAEAERSNQELLTGEFYFQYGAAAEQAGLIDKAAELLRESIRLDPAVAAEAYNYIGYMWADRDVNLEEAGEMIKKAIEAEPDNGAFLDSLGWLHFKKGEYEQALKELLRAVENMKKEDAVVFEHLGDTYQKLGKASEALSYWQRSLTLEDNPKVREKIDAAKQAASPAAAPAN
jgi:tetratricopeptide (TPR) repeat protein